MTEQSKFPRMPVRDSGGSFALDNPDDGTSIREMLSLKDRLLIFTEKCTYEVQLADQIDPKRTNPNLPHNVRRKLFDYGVQSEFVCKTLLQAKVLFQKHMLPIDTEKALELSLEALKELVAMDLGRRNFIAVETAAIESFNQTRQQARSIGLPSVGGVDSHCKTFAQKAHHFGKALHSITRLFYPTATNWDKLQEVVSAKFGLQDPFPLLVSEIKPALMTALNLRDCLEHHNESVIVRDFTMQPDGTISPPTIEMKFRKSTIPRTSVSSLMDGFISALLAFFEMLIVHLCARSVQPAAGLPLDVAELPDSFQQAQHVRFGYVAQMPDGRVLPFG